MLRIPVLTLGMAISLAAYSRGSPAAQPIDANVTIRPNTRHQTILGWSGMPWYPKVSPEVRDQVLDETAGDLGLTWFH